MKRIIALILNCFLLLCFTHGAFVNQTSTHELPRGEWSATLEGNDDFSDKPEQYVLCGYSLLAENWSTAVNNCGHTFLRGSFR